MDSHHGKSGSRSSSKCFVHLSYPVLRHSLSNTSLPALFLFSQSYKFVSHTWLHHSYNQYPTSAWSRWRLLWKPPYIPLDEVEFRRALDVYDSAEMRLGK